MGLLGPEPAGCRQPRLLSDLPRGTLTLDSWLPVSSSLCHAAQAQCLASQLPACPAHYRCCKSSVHGSAGPLPPPHPPCPPTGQDPMPSAALSLAHGQRDPAVPSHAFLRNSEHITSIKTPETLENCQFCLPTCPPSPKPGTWRRGLSPPQ